MLAVIDELAQHLLRGGYLWQPARQRAQPCHQFFHLEGFDQIIIGARIKPLDPLRGFAPRGQNQHRQRITAPAQTAGDLDPRQPRQVHIDHRDIRARA